MSSTDRQRINNAAIDDLDKKFKTIQDKIYKVEGYNDLKCLRDSLGPYYSLSIFADMAFSHTWKKLKSTLEDQLENQSSNDELEKRI